MDSQLVPLKKVREHGDSKYENALLVVVVISREMQEKSTSFGQEIHHSTLSGINPRFSGGTLFFITHLHNTKGYRRNRLVRGQVYVYCLD